MCYLFLCNHNSKNLLTNPKNEEALFFFFFLFFPFILVIFLLIALAKKVSTVCVQMIIRQFLLLILITTISETELQIKNNREGRDEKNILFTWLYIIMIYNKSSTHMNIIFFTLW